MNNKEPLICKKVSTFNKKGRKLKSTLLFDNQKKCYNTTCWHKLSAKDKIVYRVKINRGTKAIKTKAEAEAEGRQKAEAEAEGRQKAEAEAEARQSRSRSRS